MYDRVEHVDVKENHALCHISYLDTVVDGGLVCLNCPYNCSGEHFKSGSFFMVQ